MGAEHGSEASWIDEARPTMILAGVVAADGSWEAVKIVVAMSYDDADSYGVVVA